MIAGKLILGPAIAIAAAKSEADTCKRWLSGVLLGETRVGDSVPWVWVSCMVYPVRKSRSSAYWTDVQESVEDLEPTSLMGDAIIDADDGFDHLDVANNFLLLHIPCHGGRPGSKTLRRANDRIFPRTLRDSFVVVGR